MSTPLYDALLALSGSDPLRLHMPGHKGLAGGLFEAISAIDFTEITPTGNLYTGEGPIRQAELLCARAVGARDALFFTCGSTQGIFTMLSAAVAWTGPCCWTGAATRASTMAWVCWTSRRCTCPLRLCRERP